MKYQFSKLFIILFFAMSASIACKNKNAAANADNRDTIHTLMRPKEDATRVKPDSMQVEMPEKDSLHNVKDSKKK